LEGLPAWFEPNPGLYGEQVRYVSRGEGYTLLLDGEGAVVALNDGSPAARVRLELLGARASGKIEPLDLLPGKTSYLLGNRPESWRTHIPQYARVRYSQVYPGIDLIFRSSARRLEYDFVVAPGADPSAIRLKFRGATRVKLDGDGALAITVAGREIHQSRPIIYQDTLKGRRPVEGRYILTNSGEVAFFVGDYDRTLPLVIDPVLVYSDYFGGSRYDVITGIAADPDGGLWITGTTRSAVELPEQHEPYSSGISGAQDVFVAKLAVGATGPPRLLYWTYLGGKDLEYGGQILVGSDGAIYVTGSTFSSDFPVTGNAFTSTLGGADEVSSAYNQDGFIVKINPAVSGTDSLEFSSYIGGTGTDVPTAMAFYPGGRLLVAGYTSSTNLLMLENSLQPSNRGGWDAFVYLIDPNGQTGETLLYTTYTGGLATDVPTGIAADDSGLIYFAGYTFSEDFPIEGGIYGRPYKDTLDRAGDIFITIVDPSKPGLEALVYATYIGGGGLDIANALALDEAGGIWLAGYTLSPDFPVTGGALQTAFKGTSDAFLMRFDLLQAPEQAVTYATFLGGSGADVAYDLCLWEGRIALAGYTMSNDFPVAAAPWTARAGMADAFLTVLDPTVPGVGGLTFSTYFGSAHQDSGTKLAAGADGSLYMAGQTFSKNLPVTDGSQKPNPAGAPTGFLIKLTKAPED